MLRPWRALPFPKGCPVCLEVLGGEAEHGASSCVDTRKQAQEVRDREGTQEASIGQESQVSDPAEGGLYTIFTILVCPVAIK